MWASKIGIGSCAPTDAARRRDNASKIPKLFFIPASSTFLNAELGSPFRLMAVEKPVAGFAQEVRDIDRGEGIGAFHHELVTGAKKGEGLARLQRGKGAFQPAKIEARLRHPASYSRKRPVRADGRLG